MSVYILTPLLSLLVAQSIKIILETRSSKPHLRNMYVSGGMPSAHASVAVSLMAIVGLKDGFDSALFGISSVLALIVLYDAANVRFSVGEQAKLLGELVKNNKKLEQNITMPKVVRGHTVTEVAAGSLVGIIVALVIFF